MVVVFVCVFLETEGFKIDTMGTYHGMTLKSVTVRSGHCYLLIVLYEDKSYSAFEFHSEHIWKDQFLIVCIYFSSSQPKPQTDLVKRSVFLWQYKQSV